MKMPVSIVPLSLGVACLLGCSAEHVTAVDDSQTLSIDGALEDPWGLCDASWTCSVPGVPCVTNVIGGPCDSDCELRVIMSCNHECETDSDCPVPLTGEIAPVCHEGAGVCQLPCGDGAACPDGFACVAYWTDEENPTPVSLCQQDFGSQTFPILTPVDE